jgi:hypothetical protein
LTSLSLSYTHTHTHKHTQVPDETLHKDLSELISLEQNDETNTTSDVLLPLAFAGLMILSMRIFAHVVHYLVSKFISKMYVTKEQNEDLYLLLTRPSLMLWISLYFVLHDSKQSSVDSCTMLFGILIHLVVNTLEQMLSVDRFVKKLIQDSVSTMRMPKREIDELWNEVKRQELSYLKRDDIAYAVWIIFKHTHGWSPGPMKLEMLATRLMRVMSTTSNDRVTYEEFFKYFAWHGKKLDFNSNSNDGKEEETFSAKFREEDVIAENSDFNRKWFGGRKRKSSLVRHFRRKRNSMTVSSLGPKAMSVVPE